MNQGSTHMIHFPIYNMEGGESIKVLTTHMWIPLLTWKVLRIILQVASHHANIRDCGLCVCWVLYSSYAFGSHTTK